VRDLLIRNIHWLGYAFGLFFGFGAGANYAGAGFSYGPAAVHTLIVMLIVVALKWILCGPPIFKRKKNDSN